jgi:hypothetical protein
VRIYTAHLADRRPPVLVREGFSLWALLFGPFWLLARGAWIAGALSLCLSAVLALLAPLALPALAWLHGLFGNDILRLTLALHGYREEHVLAGRDEDAAFGRLLAARPDLLPDHLA